MQCTVVLQFVLFSKNKAVGVCLQFSFWQQINTLTLKSHNVIFKKIPHLGLERQIVLLFSGCQPIYLLVTVGKGHTQLYRLLLHSSYLREDATIAVVYVSQTWERAGFLSLHNSSMRPGKVPLPSLPSGG